MPKPYSDRTDTERLQSNWNKLTRLMGRSDWSAAITRAATAAEIAANIAVRHELQEQRKLEPPFVDHLLKWANGLTGKLDKILKPLYTTKDRQKIFNSLHKKAQRINEQRNLVVHSGNFMNEDEAKELFALAKEFIEEIVGCYHKSFKLQSSKEKILRPHTPVKVMKIPVILFFVLIVFSSLALAQSDLPTIGSFDDIKGLSKTYVVADNESRKAILKELKKIPAIMLVNNPDDAELFFEYKTISRNDGAQIGIFKFKSETGQLDAYVHRNGKKIIAWSESTTGGAFKGDTARRLIEKFVKRVKKK